MSVERHGEEGGLHFSCSAVSVQLSVRIWVEVHTGSGRVLLVQEQSVPDILAPAVRVTAAMAAAFAKYFIPSGALWRIQTGAPAPVACANCSHRLRQSQVKALVVINII